MTLGVSQCDSLIASIFYTDKLVTWSLCHSRASCWQRSLNYKQAPPAGSGAEPQPKLNLVHFSLKIWHLVATILIIFRRIKSIKWPNFVDI